MELPSRSIGGTWPEPAREIPSLWQTRLATRAKLTLASSPAALEECGGPVSRCSRAGR